jgi:hypothetical protein
MKVPLKVEQKVDKLEYLMVDLLVALMVDMKVVK